MQFTDLPEDIFLAVTAFLPVDSLDALSITCHASHRLCSRRSVLIEALRVQAQFPEPVIRMLASLGSSPNVRRALRHLLLGVSAIEHLRDKLRVHGERHHRSSNALRCSCFSMRGVLVLLANVSSTLAALGCPWVFYHPHSGPVSAIGRGTALFPPWHRYDRTHSPVYSQIPFASALAALEFRRMALRGREVNQMLRQTHLRFDLASVEPLARGLQTRLGWARAARMAPVEVIRWLCQGAVDGWGGGSGVDGCDALPEIRRMEFMAGIPALMLPLPEFGCLMNRTFPLHAGDTTVFSLVFPEYASILGPVKEKNTPMERVLVPTSADDATVETFQEQNRLPDRYLHLGCYIDDILSACDQHRDLNRYRPFLNTTSLQAWYATRSSLVHYEVVSATTTRSEWVGYIVPRGVRAPGSASLHTLSLATGRRGSITGVLRDTKDETAAFELTVEARAIPELVFSAQVAASGAHPAKRWMGQFTPLGICGFWKIERDDESDEEEGSSDGMERMCGAFWFYKRAWTALDDTAVAESEWSVGVDALGEDYSLTRLLGM